MFSSHKKSAAKGAFFVAAGVLAIHLSVSYLPNLPRLGPERPAQLAYISLEPR
jgi:hypothetical protein